MRLTKNSLLISKPSIGILALFIAITAFIFALAYASTGLQYQPHQSYIPEKLTINEVTFSNQQITLKVVGVKGFNGTQNIKLTNGIIKNAVGDIVQNIGLDNIPAIVTDESPTTINIDLSVALSNNQQYSVTLITTLGSSFVSPLFTT